MRQLDDIERDALSELLNMAMGQAASSLSELAGHEVIMSVPDVELIPRDTYLESIQDDSDNPLVSVSEGFAGDFSGDAVLIFFVDKSMNLVRALMEEYPSDEDLTELEEEVLIEVGNILLNACISTIANLIGQEFKTELPYFSKGTLEQVIPGSGSEDDMQILLARIAFNLKDRDIIGQLVLTLTLPALFALLDELKSKFFAPAIAGISQ